MNTITDTLILHIGLPKAGSKMLQSKIFSQFDNTNIGSAEERKHTITNELYRLFYTRNASVWRTIEGEEYCKLLNVACHQTSGNPLLISYEGLCHYVGPLRYFYDDLIEEEIWNNFYPERETQRDNEKNSFNDFFYSEKSCGYKYFPFFYHIKELLQACPWISKIKIILVLRNQPEWLASYYSQLSVNFKERASQEDFEQRVHLLINDDSMYGGGFLNWGKMVNDLICVVGKNNIFPLLIEETGTLSFWRSLAEGSELPFDPISAISDNEHIHARKFNTDTWVLRNREHFMFNNRGYRSLKHMLNPVWPYVRKNPLYDIACKYVTSIDRIGTKKLHLDADDDLADEIRAYCRPFNQELADFLGRDFKELSDLGY